MTMFYKVGDVDYPDDESTSHLAEELSGTTCHVFKDMATGEYVIVERED